jgi:anti-anti-sigma factor
MVINKPVLVKRVSEKMNYRRAREFYDSVLPALLSDRPQVVFDMAKTRQVDSTGIAVLLRCVCQAMKGDGDIKLARVSSQAAVVFELARIGQLFEMYENPTVATNSFSSPNHSRPQVFPSVCGPTGADRQPPALTR